jgi:putative ubiquitin-RnfH superfamily antitoxin RatB of RatAB toxin-antitoxin module
MDLKELTMKGQRLRRQLSELSDKVEKTKQELNETNSALREAMEDAGNAVSDLSEEEFQMVLAEFNDPRQITVEVVYATRDKQLCNEIQLSRGATIEDGIAVSGILGTFPEIDLTRFKVGIHGTVKPLDHLVREGDRIEIYRPVETSG